MPALTIDPGELQKGLGILAEAAESVTGGRIAVKSDCLGNPWCRRK